MKVAVFGGIGFIGGHVVEELLSRKIEPIVFDRHFHRDLLIKHPFGLYLGDITNREQVLNLVSQVDGAINLAGILGTSETVDNPYPSAKVNIIGALNFLEALRKHDKPGIQIAVGNHFMNNSYAITKTTAERFALMYNKEHGVKVGVVRALNAYGERQKHEPVRKIIPNFVIRALKGEPIEVYGDGKQVMDMIYVKDVAYILVEALLKDWDRQTILEAGTGRKTTVNQIADMVNKIAGSKAGIKHLPMRDGEPKGAVVVGNPLTLRPIYDHTPKLMTLEKGLKKTVKWYKENYEI